MDSSWLPEGWFYHRAEQVVGPLTAKELRFLCGCGHLKATDTIWKGWKRRADLFLLPIRVQAALKELAPTPTRHAA
jgi:hypothetical protein